jgi:hypothetical protein
MEKVNPGLSQSLGLDFGESIEKEVLSLGTNLDIEKLAWYIDNYIKTNESLKTAQIKQLPLELVTVKLAEERRTYTPKDQGNDKPGSDFTPKQGNTNISAKENNVNNDIKNNQTSNYSFKEDSINKDSTVSKEHGLSNVKENNEEENSAVSLKEEVKNDASVEVEETNNSENVNIGIDDIQAKWREFILKIKTDNHSLTFILQNCWPNDIKDGIIDLKCKYKFHQERLKDANIQDIINKNLKSIFKCDLKYATNIDGNLVIPSSRAKKEVASEEKSSENVPAQETKKQKAPVDDQQKGTINNILNAFGGEVIS